MALAYLIRPVAEADLGLVARWRAQPHVARWWGDPSVEPEEEKLADPRISLWLVEQAGRPFALIQDYAVHDWSPHHFDYLPAGSRGMDVFVGEADMLGAGHGPAFIRQHVDQALAAGAPAMGIDPHPDNTSARRAFEKAGFAVAGDPLHTRWGYALPMDRWARPADRIVGLYERRAAAWTGARGPSKRFPEQAWLDRFRALTPEGGGVLDIGCGAGEPIARYLAGVGHAVTGVDSSPAMIAMFRARLPAQQALVADMRTLDLGRRFDGLLAWDSFFHLDHAHQRRMFAIFRAHARPGAALMFTSGPEHGEAIGVLEGEPLYHASLAAAEYRDLLAANGFEVVAHKADDPDCGGRTVWLARLTP